ncbi:hypothetical protein [Streptomyces sp. NPDC048639]|uniref:hypothetical protein n=1 Tax=Streptomyces sp. NPDC048639 TaxID=3365581 RepID=UPI003713F84B
MTRAQKFQWYLEKGLAEGLRPLPLATDESAAQRLVHALEERFEILRTSLAVVDGELQQQVHSSGQPVQKVDVEPDTTPQQCVACLVKKFRGQEHGRIGSFLVQFHLLQEEDQRWLAVVADNVAMDAGFHSVVDQAIDDILAGRQRDPAADVLNGQRGIQPTEMAQRESGPHGDAERHQALEYLREHFSAAPARMHRHSPSSGTNEGRYYRSTLTLRGADSVFARVMSGTGLLPSAVILAAFTQLLCWRAASDACSINVSLDNRHNAELRRVLCSTAQRAPLTLPRQDQGLLAASADVQQALAMGHPTYGRYDPFDLISERVLAQHRRGVCLSTDLAFNFIPPPQGWAVLLESEQGPSSGTDAEITWSVTDELSYEYGASLSVRWSDPRTARLSIHGDSQVLAPEQCAALLHGIELVLARVAGGQNCTADNIAAEVGLIRLPRAPHEQRVNGQWVDLRAIEDRLLTLNGVEKAELTISPDAQSGIARLTARVAGADGITLVPLALRDELLRAVETGELLAIPDRFEIIGAAPTEYHTTIRRPAVTAEEVTVESVLAESGLIPEPNLDLCYVRAGGQLANYPEFADLLRRREYLPPSFSLVSGMTTLRTLAQELRRSVP